MTREYRWRARVALGIGATMLAASVAFAQGPPTPKSSSPPKPPASPGRPAKPPPKTGAAPTRPSPPAPPAESASTKAEIHKQQGFVYYRLGRYADARAAFETALALNQGDLALYLALGETALKTDTPRAAVDYLTRALGLSSLSRAQRAEVLERLGLVYMELGEHRPAVDTMRTALQAGQDTCAVRRTLGLALVRLEQWEPALTELQVALDRC